MRVYERTRLHRIAAKMVRQKVSLRQAVVDLNLDPVTPEEAIRLEESPAFQECFTKELYRFFKELGEDVDRNKGALVGEMLYCVRKLTEEGSYDKALEGLFKIARVEGHVGGESNVNVFANVTAKDIEEARKELSKNGKSTSKGIVQDTIQ
jgi:hypothetical protein